MERLLSLVAAGLVGGLAGASAGPEPGPLKAESLEIVDEGGTTVIALETIDGQPHLLLRSRTGGASASLLLSDDGGVFAIQTGQGEKQTNAIVYVQQGQDAGFIRGSGVVLTTPEASAKVVAGNASALRLSAGERALSLRAESAEPWLTLDGEPVELGDQPAPRRRPPLRK